MAAGVEHLREGTVGEHDATIGRERYDAGGDGLDDGFQLSAALLKRGVELGELRGGALGCGVGAFEIGGHGVEALDQFSEFFGGRLADAMRVVTGSDGLHGVG